MGLFPGEKIMVISKILHGIDYKSKRTKNLLWIEVLQKEIKALEYEKF